ncbi:predicted protein [Lichtheimia corymbifera JMRC:FSU:9682]|uniref:Uncharacterized protein n=1 Tax=Lichtheimia corymbifera JMRC:FSU:9682 TaxID=1263082 RepID=A0A068SFC5_9FUNG|nr:predicted protein [Lichtheimia corymbifera JMRC:FSU:9682]
MQQQHILHRMNTRLFASIKKWYWEYQKKAVRVLHSLTVRCYYYFYILAVYLVPSLHDDWVIQGPLQGATCLLVQDYSYDR